MKSLFDTTEINGMNLKNRFVRSATWENMADSKGHITDKLYTLYENLAKGGVGLIVTGYSYVMENEKPNNGMMGIYEDNFITEYKKFTDMIHSSSSKICMQIVYGGSQTNYNVENREIWGMWAVENKRTRVTPKEMTKEDISKLIKSFGDAAYRAKEAGFDAVQIHGAHGYLLGQSVSPYYNRREDEYGGSIENRARLIIEVYNNIRERVGKDFPVLIKLNCSDFDEEGATIEDYKYICKALDENGIDAIEISGGNLLWRTHGVGESVYSSYASEISKEIKAPIILVGLNRTMENMDNVLNGSGIEYFSMCRPFIREPALINKWITNKESKALCSSCGKCFSIEGRNCIFEK